MTLKEFVISKVKPDDYYASRFPTWNPRIRGNVRCPFHVDDRPSLAISLRNGGARCHASTCCKSVGNIVHFECELKGTLEDIAVRKLYNQFVRKTISKKVVEGYCQNLREETRLFLSIKKEMGLTPLSVRQFKLGYDPNSRRITIPIYDGYSQCINIRFYKLPSQRNKYDKAKIYNQDGYGGLDMFPYPKGGMFDPSRPVYLMASEKESMLATQANMQAFCSTSGEGSWNQDWDSLIKHCHIIVVFDTDAGGVEATKKIERILFGTAHAVSIAKLTFDQQRSDFKDFADWILREKHSVYELATIAKEPIRNGSLEHLWSQPDNKSANSSRYNDRSSFREDEKRHPKDQREQLNPPLSTNVNASVPEPQLPAFFSQQQIELSAISSRSELLNFRIKTQGIVAAKSSNTYSIPWRFKIIGAKKTSYFEFPINRNLLSFIRCSDIAILHALQKATGQSAIEIEPLCYLTATEVEIIPTAVVDRDVPYVVQKCLYFGERIESNVPYYLEVIPTSEIRTQETIGIITRFVPLSKSIDKFTLSPEIYANLSSFQPDPKETCWSKLTAIANEISTNYTRVYNRLDWHIIALLTWCSPIGFRFPGDIGKPHRGWLNSLALGDTETGKSQVANALRTVFNCGVFVNSENCTYVGLVGGAIKVGSGQLMLRWGRIPLSDKQLVVLEELSGLGVNEIANMSDVRSSGIARLDKGGINAETNSRTRLLCLSNVRHERKNLSQYLYGVQAIRELIGHGEDIARFDLITTLVDREVSNDLINSDFATVAKSQQTIRQDQLEQLCHFVWSLTPEQIQFDDAAYKACLEETKTLASEYHPSIPIFKGGSGRHKLGRISAAIACLLFSWDSKRKVVEVKRSHVLAAVRLLRTIYDKQSFGYKQYSLSMFDRENIKDTKEIRKAFVERIPKSTLPKVLEAIIHATKFSRDDFCAIAGISVSYVDHIIGALLRERAISKGDGPMWDITPAGKNYLEKLCNQLSTK